MDKVVYIVESVQYDPNYGADLSHVVKVFHNEDDAKKFCEERKGDGHKTPHLQYEEWEVE